MVACGALGKAWDLQASGERERAKKGLDLAEKWAQEVLHATNLPPSLRAEALCVLGTRYKSDGIARFALAQATLEEGLALGRTSGFVLDQEWLYADVLGDIYDHAIQLLITSDQLAQAKALLDHAEEFISHYKSFEKFDHVRHEGYALLAHGSIAGHDGQLQHAIHFLEQLLASPFKEYFASNTTHNFVLERACHNIGRIYHMAYGRSEEAIPYLQDALRYCVEGDEEFVEGQTLLDRARRKAGLIRAISAGWSRVAWGTSADEFIQTFPRAMQDDTWWLPGEEPGDLAGFAIREVKYAFNQDGQLYLIAFFPDEPSTFMAEFPDVLGAPDKRGTAGWTYGSVEVSVKAGGHIMILTNTAFDDGESA